MILFLFLIDLILHIDFIYYSNISFKRILSKETSQISKLIYFSKFIIFENMVRSLIFPPSNLNYLCQSLDLIVISNQLHYRFSAK